jgi:hypothetical protein
MAKPERNKHNECGDGRRIREPQGDRNLKSEANPIVQRNANTGREEDGDELLENNGVENSTKRIGSPKRRSSEERNVG